MRFRKIETEKGKLAQDQSGSQSQAEKSATQQEQRQEHPCLEREHGTLPLEWRELAPFVEAHRAVRPTERYLERFWHRFLPRLNRAIRKDEMVREYLRETFWPRWLLRAAAAAVVAVLAYGWVSAFQENQRLNSRLTQLERDIQATKAGM